MPRARLFIAMAFPIAALAASPYVDQTSRGIKALSDSEVADYLAGRGMGFAKAAELNGYPGPAHVLELSQQLALSPAQQQKTEAIFGRMQDDARRLGQRLVDAERALDQLFASRTISPSLLHEKLESIASLQREVREVHLQAHLEEAGVLSADQAASYWHLRGYAQGGTEHTHAH
jgi:Spy/CpxP family protein refolding chaperone